ncbi:MAG: NADPH-dependent F420 reductase [Chloroflexi bacterium]|nr:NADPH-dependent F420 reductase [Chloroflexota bacterium]
MPKPTIAVIGGTGAEGSGLALRWAVAGYPVVIGSRSAEKATATANELNVALPAGGTPLYGATNAEAAAAGEVVVLSVPYDAQADMIAQIADHCEGKTFINVSAPLKPPKVSVAWHPPGGSAALEAQAQLGEKVNVIAAFQNISANHLKDLSWQADCDVLVTGDHKAAKQTVMELVQATGLFGVDAGALSNSSVVEGLTAVLVGINIRHKIKGTGFRITGIARE